MSTKGSWQRPRTVTIEEKDLRWELAFKTSDRPERKKEILKRLTEIEEEK